MTFVKIAREKAGKVHFAARVEPSGAVSRWSESEADAVAVKEDLAERACAHYDARPGAGTLMFANAGGGPWGPPGAGARTALAAPAGPAGSALDLPTDAEREYRRQAVALQDEVERLEADLAAAALETARLRAANAELEALLAAAK